jgi:hypothetical protein
MGGGFILELGEFGVDRGVAGEVLDDKGRRGVCGDARRRDACGEVGAEAFPEAIGFEAAGAELSPVYCVLVALLVLVNKV